MSSEKRYDLSLAGLSVRIETEQELETRPEFLPFLIRSEKPDFRVRFRQVEELPVFPEQILHEDFCYRVHPDGKGGYTRSFFDAPRDMAPYGVVTCDYPGGAVWVDYLEKGARCVSDFYNSFAHLDFEGMLIRRDRLCFHAACVRTELGGILFSGRSGIGKSTQAELWQKHRGAVQINGDRPILARTEKGWLAWGSPYAGSSRCHVNASCPVSAVVMLRQTPECSLRRLKPSEAFRALWSGVTVHNWDRAFMEKACDLVMELAVSIPVLELACTPDERAVTCLEAGLRKECGL